MKKLNYFFIASTLIAANFLVSCSPRNMALSGNGYSQYASNEQPEEAAAVSAKQTLAPTITEKTFAEKYTVVNEANVTTPKVVKSKSKAGQATSTLATGAAPVKKLTKQEKKDIKQLLKKESKKAKSDDHTILLVIVAILLPPLAVFLFEGIGKGIETPFWLDVLLWLLFYIPGLVYALWRILK